MMALICLVARNLYFFGRPFQIKKFNRGLEHCPRLIYIQGRTQVIQPFHMHFYANSNVTKVPHNDAEGQQGFWQAVLDKNTHIISYSPTRNVYLGLQHSHRPL